MSAIVPTLYIDNRDLRDVALERGALWFNLEKLTGANGGVADQLARVNAPGSYGSLVTSAAPSAGPGSVGFTFRIRCTTLDSLASVLRALNARLAQGTVALRTDFDSTLEATAQLSEFQSVQIDEPWNKTAIVSGTYTLDDPLWYDRLPQSFSIRSSKAGVGQRVSLPIGTGVSAPFVRIFGPSGTTLTLNYRNAQGDVMGSMTFAAAAGNVLAATDFLDINSGPKRVFKTASSVRGTKEAGWALVVAPSTYPLLDPEDGDRYGNVWPTLEIVDSANTATAWVSYTRSWR